MVVHLNEDYDSSLGVDLHFLKPMPLNMFEESNIINIFTTRFMIGISVVDSLHLKKNTCKAKPLEHMKRKRGDRDRDGNNIAPLSRHKWRASKQYGALTRMPTWGGPPSLTDYMNIDQDMSLEDVDYDYE